MSEELRQRYPKGIGRKIGRFELFETQLTTISQYAEYGILPNIEYGEYKNRKPDAIIIDRIPNIHPVVVGEHKDLGILNEDNWESFAYELITTKSKPTNAAIAYLTDGVSTYWLNGQSDKVEQIKWEDSDYSINTVLFDDATFISKFEYMISYYDLQANVVISKQKTNPHKLADEIWQIIWRLKADQPEDCLATFVELFVFKFLDDLGLLVSDENGNDVSLSHVMTIEKSKSYRYYYTTVREHIKKLFPAGSDGYSIINGIVLNMTNVDHNIIFHEIMKKFIIFGSLKNTDPSFKSKLYESFLQESKTTSTFGQHFTPRTIVAAIHEMANVDALSSGKKICDPACGVGGFILEQMAKDLSAQWILKDNEMEPMHDLRAYDIVPKTIILAKANALVHCGDYLADQPSRITSFARWLNETFICCDTTALGSLDTMTEKHFDMILTNPPFVVSGSKEIGKLIKNNHKRKEYYSQKYSGIEGLFVQFVIKALKANGDAWILLPESFFLRSIDSSLRSWMLKTCRIDFMAILPERTFFNTSKRVVITHLKKRQADATKYLNEKTLLFAALEIGETRDSKRLPCESDIPAMIQCYKAFSVGIHPQDNKSVIVDSKKLVGQKTLNLRHFWDKDVAIQLGLIKPIITPEEELNSLRASVDELKNIVEVWNKSSVGTLPPNPTSWKTVSIGDSSLFKICIGKRVLKKDIYLNKTDIPLFSANIRKAFGYVHSANAGGLESGGVLWSIDSDFDCRRVPSGEIYAITDHCGQLELLVNTIDPGFLAYQILLAGREIGFNREYRPSLQVMRTLEISLPVKSDGSFDIEIMRLWSDYRESIDFFKQNLKESLADI